MNVKYACKHFEIIQSYIWKRLQPLSYIEEEMGNHDVYAKQLSNILNSSQNLLFLIFWSNFLGENLVKRGLWKISTCHKIGCHGQISLEKNDQFSFPWELSGPLNANESP